MAPIDSRDHRDLGDRIGLPQRLAADLVVGEPPELLVLPVDEDEPAVRGHGDRRWRACCRSGCAGGPPRIVHARRPAPAGSRRSKRARELLVGGERLVGDELEHSDGVGARQDRHGQAGTKTELDPDRGPVARQLLQRDDERPAAVSREAPTRPPSAFAASAGSPIRSLSRRTPAASPQRDTREAAAVAVGRASVASRNVPYLASSSRCQMPVDTRRRGRRG